jgi:hypothetical protein
MQIEKVILIETSYFKMITFYLWWLFYEMKYVQYVCVYKWNILGGMVKQCP